MTSKRIASRPAAFLIMLLLTCCGDTAEQKKLDDGSAETPTTPPPQAETREIPRAKPIETYLQEIALGAIDHAQLELRGQGADERIHQKDSDKPYSGWIRELQAEGTLRGLVQVAHGKLDGLAFQWDENGNKKKKGSYRQGVEHGPYMEWHPNGQKFSEGRYHEGQMEGTWTQWHANGQVSQQTDYHAGVLEGPSTTWNERGRKLREGNHRHGKPEGLWVAYYADGKRERESRYRDGKPEGLWTGWYPNGRKKKEVTFSDGTMDGHFAEWNESGQLMSRGTYRDGKMDGVTTTWSESGEKTSEILFRDGQPTEEKDFPRAALDDGTGPAPGHGMLTGNDRNAGDRAATMTSNSLFQSSTRAPHRSVTTTEQQTSLPASSLASVARSTAGHVHTVAPGDTLWGISRRYKVSVSAIKTANALTSDVLRPNHQLHIPVRE